MASTFTATVSYSNLTRLELEQLRKADFYAGLKALTVGDSDASPPDGGLTVGKGSINAEPYLTGPTIKLSDVYTITPPPQPGLQLGSGGSMGICLPTFILASQIPTVDVGTWFGPTFVVESTSGIATGASAFQDANVNFATFLSGTFNVSNGSSTVTATVNQSGTLVAGDTITFASQPAVAYTITGSPTTTITLSAAYNGTPNSATTATASLVGPSRDGAVTPSVYVGDILFISNGLNQFAVGTVASIVDANDLTLTNINNGTGGSTLAVVGGDFVDYTVVRPNAVQLFAVPGSGPTGAEQTFMSVTPISTLHSNSAPTVDQINTDRIPNIIPAQYGLNSTVDRADAMYDAPGGPRLSTNKLGYRVVLYPDNGFGTGPNLAAPITTLTPVIDPSIPAGDQRLTFDYKAGLVRFSCSPQVGGQVKVVNTLSGTFNVQNGSPTVHSSVNQTLPAGAVITFASQPGQLYTLNAAVNAGTTITLTSNYGGTTNTTTTATTQGVNGTTGRLNLYAVYWAINQPGSTTSNIPSLDGLLMGNFGVTNGLATVTTTVNQQNTNLAIGQQITFASQPGTLYTVLGSITSSGFTLSSVYTGTTNASTNASISGRSAGAASCLYSYDGSYSFSTLDDILNLVEEETSELQTELTNLANSAPAVNWSVDKFSAELYFTPQPVSGISVLNYGSATFFPSYDVLNNNWTMVEINQIPNFGSTLGQTANLTFGTNAVATSGDTTGFVGPGLLLEFGTTSLPCLVESVNPSSIYLTKPYPGPDASGASIQLPSFSTNICLSIDGGKSWSTAINVSTTGLPRGYMTATAGSHTVGFLVTSDTLINNRFWFDLTTQTALHAATSTVGTTTGCGLAYSVPAGQFLEVDWVQSGGNYVGHAFLNTVSISSFVSTDVTASLPGTWQAGTAVISNMRTASNATDVVVAMQTTAATDRLLDYNSGGTFADITPAITTGHHIFGLAYDSVNLLWGLLLDNGKLYTCSDASPHAGSTWNLVFTFPLGGFALAVSNGVWAVSFPQLYNGTTVFRVAISTNRSSWQATNGATPNSTIAINLFSGPNQFMGVTYDGLHVIISDGASLV